MAVAAVAMAPLVAVAGGADPGLAAAATVAAASAGAAAAAAAAAAAGAAAAAVSAAPVAQGAVLGALVRFRMKAGAAAWAVVAPGLPGAAAAAMAACLRSTRRQPVEPEPQLGLGLLLATTVTTVRATTGDLKAYTVA